MELNPAATKKFVSSGASPSMIAVVGREAFRPVEEGVDTRLGQHRQPVDGHLQDRLEMVEILGKLVEAEILRDAVHRPRASHSARKAPSSILPASSL